MKKSVYFLFLMFLSLSCNNGDDKLTENHEFQNKIIGEYRLSAAYTDVPIDLNFDGIPQTNVVEEAECFVYFPVDFYRAQFRINGEYKSLWLTIMYRDMESEEQCLYDTTMFYDYEVDEGTKEIVITYRGDANETEYGTLKRVKWIDNVAYYEYEKKFFTSDGWKTVVLTMEYKKISSNV